MNDRRLFFSFLTIDGWYKEFIKDEINELGLYIKTIESLISREEKREVEQLENFLSNHPDIPSGDFWADNYPTHWDEVFSSQLRLSFVIWAVATFEQKLKHASDFLARELGGNWKEPEREFLKSTKKFYRAIGFSRPEDKLWDQMDNNIKIRNFLVHRGLFVGERDNKKAKNILRIAKRENGIEIGSLSFIEVKSEYCKQIISTMSAFFKDLFAEAKEIETRKKKQKSERN